MTIKLLNFTKKFKDNIIFQNVNLSIPKGMYRIKGKNGSGKSTFLRIIARLDDNYTGKVNVPQKSILYLNVNPIGIHPFSIRENLEILWNTFNISPTVSQKNIVEEFFDYNLDVSYSSSSTGMKAKLGLSLIFVKKWDLIIIDETLSTLDEESVDNISNSLIDMCKNHNSTVFFVSHSNVSEKLINNSSELLIDQEELREK